MAERLLSSCPRCEVDHFVGSPECPGSLVGSLLAGRYRLDRLLGSGGFGAVYLAEHLELGTRFAVKTLLPRAALDPRGSERFLREARTAASLDHPGIVRVTDFGRDGSGQPFLVMEYLEGSPLNEVLARLGGRLSVDAAIHLAAGVLLPLAYAHGRGVVHRDLKPANVFCLQEGDGPGGIKIVDFGLAKTLGVGNDLTSTGSFLGTPHFASPEQVLDAVRADARADVYSMGAMLYFLLTGEPPVVGSSGNEVLGRIAAGKVSRHPRVVRATIPVWLDALVARALAHDRDERFVSASEMLMTLQAYRVPGGDDETTPMLSFESGTRPEEEQSQGKRKPRLTRGMLGVMAGVVLLVVGLAALPLLQWGGAPDGMVVVRGGSFLMGSTEEEVEASEAWCSSLVAAGCSRESYLRETPARQVRVSPFAMDRTEITNVQFARWLASLDDLTGAESLEFPDLEVVHNGERLALLDDDGGIVRDDGFRPRPGRGDEPVTLVTWHGAMAYCQAQGKTLPTEAQWEWAARGRERRAFPWGHEPPGCEQVVFGRRAPGGPCTTFGPARPAPAGTAPGDRTREGIHDLGGNVSEWVRDHFVARYPACDGVCEDPFQDGDGEDRALRGGNWWEIEEMTRAAGRYRMGSNEVSLQVGFRCVLERSERR